MKFNGLKILIFFVVAILSLFVVIFFHAKYAEQTMNAMNKEALSCIEFNKELNDRMLETAYTANPKEYSAPVTFKIDLNNKSSQDLYVIIESEKAGGVIYKGPFVDEFSLMAGKALFDKGGGDNFKFIFYKKSTCEVFTAQHDSDFFWKIGKVVRIKLLPQREIDNRSGLPVAFKISFE